ncbi:diguanylate cyclase (GGDEF)-like protein [Fluviicoccus keumensis]|uniref:diguanylate cyclase n=1 Tax=Fluviicoccus keumensis TaxID=1435465 RepID=A0A4Q7Z496_9GAMM|nr:GGDEF domain-containing protein [Fluviicoccus keumensis]RZU45068.1 diguanylate cyclase (GGDEF)-like protein [Fluviicoccus keumensis]
MPIPGEPLPGDAPSADPLGEARSALAELLTDAGRRRKRFSPMMERAYREHMLARARNVMRANTLRVAVFYLFIGILTFEYVKMMSSTVTGNFDLILWTGIYLGGALVMSAVTLSARKPALHRWYGYTVGLSCYLGLVGLTVTGAAFLSPYLNQQSTYIVIYLYMIVYILSTLPLLTNIAIGVGASLTSLLLIHFGGLSLDIVMFAQYAGLSNVMGVAIAWMLDHRDRQAFLQERLLDIEKQQLNLLSQEMARLSREDGLTTLANRRYFNETLAREWAVAEREQQPVSLVFVDVDHFKPYNDTYGHLEGDNALRAVGKTLKSLVRRPSDMAARYGGEEFVLLLPNTDQEGAMAVAQEVRDAIDALQIPHRGSKVAKFLSVSIGLSTLVPGSDNSISTLIDQADEGVYAAKRAGRHRIRAFHLLKSRSSAHPE